MPKLKYLHKLCVTIYIILSFVYLYCLYSDAFSQYSVVVLEFSNRDVRVHENEGEAIVCVTISTRIARPLQFVIIHSSSTSGRIEILIIMIF